MSTATQVLISNILLKNLIKIFCGVDDSLNNFLKLFNKNILTPRLNNAFFFISDVIGFSKIDSSIFIDNFVHNAEIKPEVITTKKNVSIETLSIFKKLLCITTVPNNKTKNIGMHLIKKLSNGLSSLLNALGFLI